MPLVFLLFIFIEFPNGLHWLRFYDLLAALLAGTTRIVIPEIEHRLTEMLDDVCAVEMDVFHQCSAVLAVKNNVLFFSRRTAPFHHDSNRIRRPLRRVRHIRRDKECFSFSDNVIHDAVAFPNAHLRSEEHTSELQSPM